MGLENSQGNVIYLSIFNGKITRRVKEGTPGSVERKTKTDKIVHELVYDKLSGTLANIEFRDGDYGKEIHFVVKDGEDTYRLQLQFSAGVSKSFVMRLLNADLSKTMEFHTGWDKDKEKTFAYITQDGSTVKSPYTKDNPGDLPPMVKIKVKGQEVWDDSDQLEFIDKKLKEVILPKLRKNTETMTPAQEDILPDIEPSDDLPF